MFSFDKSLKDKIKKEIESLLRVIGITCVLICLYMGVKTQFSLNELLVDAAMLGIISFLIDYAFLRKDESEGKNGRKK